MENETVKQFLNQNSYSPHETVTIRNTIEIVLLNQKLSS